jgi:hypothetical protein
VFRFVGSRVRDRSLVEDLTSETFLRALRRIDFGGCQVRNAGAWFTTIARNLVLDYARYSRRRPERATAKIVDFPTVETGPEWAVIRRNTGVEGRRRVGELPPDQRHIHPASHWHAANFPHTFLREARRREGIPASALPASCLRRTACVILAPLVLCSLRDAVPR